MLNFIIGRKNSGKTLTAHRILGEAVDRGDECMLIVPKQFTFESDKGILSVLSAKKASEIEVLSFGRLCHIVMQQYGGVGKPVASGGIRSVLMSLAVDSVSEQLKTFSKHKGEIALTEKLLCQIDEMKNNGITPDTLERVAEKTKDKLLSQKLSEMALICRAYDAVASQKYFDDGDLLTKIAETVRDTGFFRNKTIVIDGFTAFSYGEYRLIEQMLISARDVYVTLCTDSVTDTNELSPFAVVNRTARRLMLLAGNNAVETGEAIRCERSRDISEELCAVETQLFKADYKALDKECTAVSVMCSKDINSECDAIARKIKSIIRQGDYRCRDIAVVFRQGEEYEKGIRNALRKYGVPLFEDKRQPVTNQPLICFVRNLLSICCEGFRSDYIFRFCKTGLTPFDAQQISLVENYVFMWDIDGKRWLQSWNENPKGFGREPDEESDAILGEINDIRQKLVTPVEKFRKETELCSGKALTEKLYRFLRESKTDEQLKEYALFLEEKGLYELAVEQEQTWDLLMQVFDEIAQSLEDNTVSVRRYLELFELVLSTVSLGKLPDGFDEVSIVSAERALTKKAKIVFVVGLNDGVFPLNAGQDGIFTQAERAKLSFEGLEEMQQLRERVLKERLLCYNALSCADERLYVSYALSSNSGESLTKSECVEWVEKILLRVATEDTSDCPIEDLIESERAAFGVVAKNWKENNGKITALKQYFSEKEEYGGRLKAISLAVSDKPYRFSDKTKATELFGENLYFSASQLEVYSQCPFMYFCRYGLKAQPRKKARLDPAQSGTVIHFVLEKLLGKYKGKEILGVSEDALNKEIKALLYEYMSTSMGGFDGKGERFRYLYLRMEKVLRSLLCRIREEFSQSDFETWDFELDISRESDVKPFKIQLDRGVAEFYGVIDRVDKLDLDGKRYIRVVDYKTGVKKFRLSDVLAGLNMQMLLYLISIWRNGKGDYENIIPSGVLYFPARMETNSVSRESSSEEKQNSRFSATTMSGMLLEDEQIIKRMDKQLRGLFIPVKFDAKKGTVKGDFISMESFRRLAERLDGYIEEIGNSIHDGLVDARPVSGTGHGDTCTWCDYRDVCMRENENIRYVENLNHSECIRIIGGEGNGEKVD